MKGTLTKEQADDIKAVFDAFGLPVTVDGLKWEDVYSITKSDKKWIPAWLNSFSLKTIGDAYVDRTITEEEMKEGFSHIAGGAKGEER